MLQRNLLYLASHVATVGRISRAEGESDRHRRAQVISAGRPDTLFMWGWELGGGYTRVVARQCGLDGLLEYLAAGTAWTISQPAKFLSGPTDGTNLLCRRKEMFDSLVDVRHRRIVTAAREQMRDGEQRNGRGKPGLLFAEIPCCPYQR
jgi:hypothetical protein